MKVINLRNVLLLIFLIHGTCIAQNFEGKITYKTTYKSKVPNVTDEVFTQMMGSALEYSYKHGNYRTTSNGTFLQWQLYVHKDNKLYTKFSSSPSILWNDGAVNPDSVLKSELNKNVIEILGNQCDELVLTCKTGVQKYYFSAKYKLDPALFQNHKFGNFYEYVSKPKALPLRIVIDNVQFAMDATASSIEAQKISDEIFVLPANATLEKSPY